MFESAQEPPGFGLFLLQQLLVSAGGMILSPLASLMLAALVPATLDLKSSIAGPIAAALVGSLSGQKVVSRWPRMASGGLWVWVAPTGLLLAACLSYLIRHESLFNIVRTLFYVGPGAPEMGLGPYLMTYPTMVSCFYSLAARRAGGSRRGE